MYETMLDVYNAKTKGPKIYHCGTPVAMIERVASVSDPLRSSIQINLKEVASIHT